MQEMQETQIQSLGGKVPWRRAWPPNQYSSLENLMDRGDLRPTVHRVAKNQMWLKWLSTHNIWSLLSIAQNGT